MTNVLQSATPAGSFLLTENKKGFMIEYLDSYCEEFIDIIKTSPKPVKVADFGVAFGYTTKLLLKAGADVIANDLSENHLDALWTSVTAQDRTHLRLLPGNVLDLELPAGSLHGILACRWIHFLTGEELRTVLAKFFKWLVPGGRLCLTAESVYLGSHKEIFDKYLERKANSVEWPGFVQVADLSTKRKQHMPSYLHLYDTDVLERELSKANFQIDRCGYIARPNYPEDLRNGGREAIGSIALNCPNHDALVKGTERHGGLPLGPHPLSPIADDAAVFTMAEDCGHFSIKNSSFSHCSLK
ncbi:hypothetical protein BV898_12655 [Hypsibius exemplaris]|uniref:Methyltransferase domain-containing protein n=1 Tax=Hypsibius exemplaris TaxID=2072580 RepID=A0A1W0WD14_HYPEX|nr:hypothetical protein BV898_12655 [Hypsibius exemplaris]